MKKLIEQAKEMFKDNPFVESCWTAGYSGVIDSSTIESFSSKRDGVKMIMANLLSTEKVVVLYDNGEWSKVKQQS